MEDDSLVNTAETYAGFDAGYTYSPATVRSPPLKGKVEKTNVKFSS